MTKDLAYSYIKPDESIADYVEGFWMLRNLSEEERELVILPDGRIDLFLAQSTTEPFHIILSGLETVPDHAVLKAGTIMFAISFKLPAMEYIFQDTVASILDYARYMPLGFWGFYTEDLQQFDHFCRKATLKIQSLLPEAMDTRKQALFKLIYSSNEVDTVKELSEKVFWSSRQINRYFQQQFGLSLKTYINILRFRSSFQHIKNGKLFPEENFADQSHFIHTVKKLSGVSPKELRRNKNDRFVQFSTLPKQ